MDRDFIDIDYKDIKNMFEENKKAFISNEKISKNLRNKRPNSIPEFLCYYNNLLSYANDVMISYPHGTLIKEGNKIAYYRGEKKVYPTNKSSLLRKLEDFHTEKEKETYKLVAYMRIYEFENFINQFEYISEWYKQVGTTILYEALAQHYGLETYYLDITTNFMTALFFATCTFDYTLNEWRPLTKEEIKENEYGIIYRNKNDSVDFLNNIKIGENDKSAILPIGKQPFMRCEYQSAYTIKSEEGIDLRKINFEKLRFKHSEELSERVYLYMDKGKKIYPDEGIEAFQDEIKTISKLTVFSYSSFEYALKRSSYFNDIETAIEAIKTFKYFPIKVLEKDNFMKVSRQRRRNFDRKYEKNICKYKEIFIPYVYIPE